MKISDFNEACLDSLISLSKKDPIIRDWVQFSIKQVEASSSSKSTFDTIKLKMDALLRAPEMRSTALNVEKNRFASGTRFEKKHTNDLYKYGTAILAIEKNIPRIKALVIRVDRLIGQANPFNEVKFQNMDKKNIRDYSNQLKGTRLHTVPNGIRIPKEMYIYKGDFIKKGLFEFEIEAYAKRIALVTHEFKALLEREEKNPIKSPTMGRLIEAELASLKEFAWVNNGIVGPSFSNRNPAFFLNHNEQFKYDSSLLQDYKRRMRGPGDSIIKKWDKYYTEKGSISMVLGKNTGMAFASRGTDGDWNTYMTVLSGVVAHYLDTGALTIKQLTEEWAKFTSIPLNSATPGTRLSRGDGVPLTVNTKRGVVVFGYLSGDMPKGRHIAMVNKFIIVLNRKVAKRSIAVQKEGAYYETDMIVVRANADDAYRRKKDIWTIDYGKQDRHYTEAIIRPFLDTYTINNKEKEYLEYEVNCNAIIQPRYENDAGYIVPLNLHMNPSGWSCTGTLNTSTAELNQGSFHQINMGSYDRYLAQNSMKRNGIWSVGSGDDGMMTLPDGVKFEDMVKHIEKDIGFSCTSGDLPIYLSIFFGPNFTTNIMANAMQNHLVGEQAKDHPLILTVSMGVHYSLLNQHPFFKWWEKAMNEHILSIPGYAFYKTVEECHKFVTSTRAINLLTDYAASSIANAEKLRSVIRGLVYGYAANEGAQIPMDKELTNFLSSIYALNVGDQAVSFNPQIVPVGLTLKRLIHEAMKYSATGDALAKANVTNMMLKFLPKLRYEYVTDEEKNTQNRTKRMNAALDDD